MSADPQRTEVTRCSARVRRRLGVVASLASMLLVLQAPAHAVLPGGNGDFLVVQEVSDRADDLEILRVGPDGENLVNLTESGLDQNQPVWSPDGRTIAYTSDGSLKLMRGDGSRSRLLIRVGPNWRPTSPAWSPDGTKLAYARSYWNEEGEWARGAVYILDLGSGKSSFVAPSGIYNTEIDWSPDGKLLVFQHWRFLVADQVWGSRVMVVRPDGSGLRDLSQLTGGDDHDWRPSFLSDGRIVFRRYGTCIAVYCAAGFYVVNPDGTGMELLPLRPEDWTGDGQRDTADRLRQSPDGRSWAALVFDPVAGVHQLWRLNSSMTEREKVYDSVFWMFDWQPRCTVRGTSGDDVLIGTSGRDLICGLGGDDSIDGLGGNDVVFGHVGDDHIEGGAGADTVVGGPGRDRCDLDREDHSRVC